MTLTRRYVSLLAVGALALTVLSFYVAYRDWSTVARSGDELLQRALVSTFFEVCDLIFGAAPYLIGLTFAVGLVESLRGAEGPVLSPSLLMLTVGTLVTLAATASFYDVVSSNDVSPLFAARGGVLAVVPHLGVSLLLSAVLFGVASLKARLQG